MNKKAALISAPLQESPCDSCSAQGEDSRQVKKAALISAPLQESPCDSCSAQGEVCCRGEELIPSAALFIFLSGAAWTWVVAADFPVRVADGSGIFLLFIELFPALFGQ